MRAGEEAIVAEHRCFHLDRGGQAEEDDVGLPCHFGRILCLDGAAFDEIVDRRPITVAEIRQRIALLANVLRRAVPHEADADIADAFHPSPPDPVAWRKPWHDGSGFDKAAGHVGTERQAALSPCGRGKGAGSASEVLRQPLTSPLLRNGSPPLPARGEATPRPAPYSCAARKTP